MAMHSSVGIDVPEYVGRGDHGQGDLPRREEVDGEREQVVDEHKYRYEEHEQPVLRVRELDREGVAGWSEVDQPGPIDVVVRAQPHRGPT